VIRVWEHEDPVAAADRIEARVRTRRDELRSARSSPRTRARPDAPSRRT
jgi:hypothetical protein